VSDKLILPNTGTEYDPSTAQDHTDQPFKSAAKLPEHRKGDPKYDAALLMKRPAWYSCPHCSSKKVRLLLESSPEGDGLMQIHCWSCKAMAPVMALGQVQVTNHIARKLGIHVPDPTFDFTIDPRG
jgi:hypothetical protein